MASGKAVLNEREAYGRLAYLARRAERERRRYAFVSPETLALIREAQCQLNAIRTER